MKYLILLTLIFGLTFIGCKQNNQTTGTTENKTENLKATEDSKDKEEIQNLIRQVLNWNDSKRNIDLLPVVADSIDSLYIGFDIEQHNANLQKLRQTNFFANEFIENYNQIILTLDKKLKDKEFDDWLVGDMPPFIFLNGVNPWCLCQDVPYNNPNPLDLVEVEIINLNSENGVLDWKWGNLKSDYHPSWKEFTYRFRVVKENNKWKIAYLQGFDFKESTRNDGL
ncbi:MAG: hypothetical protein K8R58_13410 [Bacteroidales bacterium]|nr:hypothetical protein [Bacteroidales bacterium]